MITCDRHTKAAWGRRRHNIPPTRSKVLTWYAMNLGKYSLLVEAIDLNAAFKVAVLELEKHCDAIGETVQLSYILSGRKWGEPVLSCEAYILAEHVLNWLGYTVERRPPVEVTDDQMKSLSQNLVPPKFWELVVGIPVGGGPGKEGPGWIPGQMTLMEALDFSKVIREDLEALGGFSHASGFGGGVRDIEIVFRTREAAEQAQEAAQALLEAKGIQPITRRPEDGMCSQNGGCYLRPSSLKVWPGG